MTFPVVGSNVPLAYQISNSLRFNDGDSPYLSRTPGSASDRRTFTFSFWYKRGNLGSIQHFYTNQNDLFAIESGDYIFFDFNGASAGTFSFANTLLRDVSAWYHIVLTVDTTDATGADRLKLYINGERITPSSSTPPSQNYQTNINNTQIQVIGKRQSNNDRYLDGYLSEFHFIDGQALTPSNFGESDLDSGVWKPKQYEGTYGTNGFYLKFNNTGNMGEDSSGNDNTFTPTNLSGTTDVMPDSPTNNFCTLNPIWQLSSNQATPSEGNLQANSSGEISTFEIPKAGKWYWEVDVRNANGYTGIGFTNYTYSQYLRWNVAYGSWTNASAGTLNAGNQTAQTNCVVMLAFDYDNQKFYMGVNGTWFNSGNPSTGTNSTLDLATSTTGYWFAEHNLFNGGTMVYNFGQDSSFAGGKTRQNNTDGNGYGDFYYTPPSGYLALCTQNLATALSPTIDDASYYFDTALHTGNNGSGRTFTGLNFQPDLIWGKVRDSSNYTPFSVDSSRGGTNFLTISSTASEDPGSHGKVNSFNSDGTTWIDGTNGTYPRLYYNDGSGSTLGGSTYVFWQWKANGGTTSSNTDGSITSTVQANTTAGFSIVTYTGDGSSSSTVGHGLGQTPDMIIIKRRNSTYGWNVWHQKLTTNYNMYLNDTSGEFSPTSKVHGGIGTPSSTIMNWISGSSTINNVNENGGTYVSYCFAEIEGYSKFGSYTGNGSTDGTFVYTGFRPAFVIVKRTNSTGYWLMFDSARQPENENDSWLLANDSSNEGINSTGMDFISNGFKLRNSSTAAVHNNISGSTYIYMAFAENPFVTSGNVPVTAR